VATITCHRLVARQGSLHQQNGRCNADSTQAATIHNATQQQKDTTHRKQGPVLLVFSLVLAASTNSSAKVIAARHGP